jgi:crossover junction endodeoxyribonuclease RusA
MELKFPIEFVVRGTPVSSQAKRPESRDQWKELVVEASKNALPEAHFATESRIAVSLFYFPGSEMQGDIDNIVKYTLDALCQHIYLDDHQVERVVVQKFEPDRIYPFDNPSAVLLEALEERGPALYVRISDDPHGELNR